MSSLWPQLRKRENFLSFILIFVIRCHGGISSRQGYSLMLDDRSSSRERTSHLSSLLVTAGVISLGSCSPAVLHSLLCQVDARLMIQPLFMSFGSSLWPPYLTLTIYSSHYSAFQSWGTTWILQQILHVIFFKSRIFWEAFLLPQWASVASSADQPELGRWGNMLDIWPEQPKRVLCADSVHFNAKSNNKWFVSLFTSLIEWKGSHFLYIAVFPLPPWTGQRLLVSQQNLLRKSQVWRRKGRNCLLYSYWGFLGPFSPAGCVLTCMREWVDHSSIVQA